MIRQNLKELTLLILEEKLWRTFHCNAKTVLQNLRTVSLSVYHSQKKKITLSYLKTMKKRSLFWTLRSLQPVIHFIAQRAQCAYIATVSRLEFHFWFATWSQVMIPDITVAKSWMGLFRMRRSPIYSAFAISYMTATVLHSSFCSDACF